MPLRIRLEDSSFGRDSTARRSLSTEKGHVEAFAVCGIILGGDLGPPGCDMLLFGDVELDPTASAAGEELRTEMGI